MNQRWRINQAATAAIAIASFAFVAFTHSSPAHAADAAASAPAASAPAFDPAAALIAPGSTQVERDEAARRLLEQKQDSALQTLLAALRDTTNPSAQRAVARALQSDQMPDKRFIAPLFALVGTSKENTDAAIPALANYRDDRDVKSRLVALASDPAHNQKLETRLAAIKAMAGMTDRFAVGALVMLVTTDPSAQIRVAAADSLTKMTGAPAGQDPRQWQEWWDKNGDKSDAAFDRDLLDARSARLTQLEARFERVVTESQNLLKESYLSAAEKSREAILLRYLRAGEPETRIVGVQLIRDDFLQSRKPTPPVSERLRTMVSDSSPQVRKEVAATLGLLNDPGAVAAIVAQLKQEPNADVRAALAEALSNTQDLRVIPPLLDLLQDPSAHVVEAAANALHQLGPVINNDKTLSQRVATELQNTFKAAPTTPGSAPLRAALIDAMGVLDEPQLEMVYPPLLSPNEPTPVRCAALRALGRIKAPWAADNISNLVDDPDDTVRLEAINALDTTGNFAQAEKLYNVLKNPQEKPAIRQRAWEVLHNRFSDPTATNDALAFWADRRFRDEPERRIEILEVLRSRFTAAKDQASLFTVQQNIGEEKMKLSKTAAEAGDSATAVARAQEAEKDFADALQYYRSTHPDGQDMTTSALIEFRMDALLASKQYAKAAAFASESIQRSATNQEAMGNKLRDEIARLRTASDYKDALSLIDAVNHMNPKLADTFLNSINDLESDIRKKMAATPGSQSAVGSGS